MSGLDGPLSEGEQVTARSVVRLLRLMAKLRSPEGGCPWDRKQDLHSLKRYLLEETHELLDAIEEGGIESHRQELGDLLFQVIFQSQIRSEAQEFHFGDVADAIVEKMVRRHPHVFADESFESEAAQKKRWDELKAEEKKDRPAIDIPRTLPALAFAQRLGEKVGGLGFDWSDRHGPKAKINEELAEVEEVADSEDKEAQARELGDLLFSVVNYARHLGVEAEDSLRQASGRFLARFELVQQEAARQGADLKETPLETLERWWEEAKAAISDGRGSSNPD